MNRQIARLGRFFAPVFIAGALLCLLLAARQQILAQGPPPPPPPPGFTPLPQLIPPSVLNPGGLPQRALPNRPVPSIVPPAFRPIPQPIGLPGQTIVGRSPIRMVNGPQHLPLAANVLAFDQDVLETKLAAGETLAHLTCHFTNLTTTNIVVNWVKTSCGCTTPKLPSIPWTIEPGTSHPLAFDVDMRGKYGTLVKVATVDTSAGAKLLSLRVHGPEAPKLALAATPAGTDAMGGRVRNLQIAAADRQAVFRNDCAKCHVEPSIGKTGGELYGAACGICHDAEHRASMVPDLHALKNPLDRAGWKQWVAIGKPGTLMPAFSKAQGGPLTDDQVESLVEFLASAEFKNRLPAAAAAAAASAHLPAGNPAVRPGALGPVVAQ